MPTIDERIDAKLRAFRQQLITEWQGQFTPSAHDILDHSGFPGGTSTFLRADDTFAAPPGGGTPSATVAALDGTGAAGSSTDYSRGDHKHADANRPTDDEKDALAGTGTPSASNPYVNDDDARLFGGGAGATPLPTSWTLRNSIVVNDYLAPTGQFVAALITDNASVNFRFASKTLNGASTYTLIATLSGIIPLGGNSFVMGVFLSDGTKIETFEILVQVSAPNQLEVRQANNVTSGGSIVAGPTSGLVSTHGVTLKVVKDATNRTFYYYSNGAFVQFFQEAASAFLTETEVGFGGLSINSASVRVEVNLIQWSLV